LTYLKAAIIRADSGSANLNSIQFILGSLDTVFYTLFAPTNQAFINFLKSVISQNLINQGVPLSTALAQATSLVSTPDVFNNPALFSFLSASKVKGILLYHFLGKIAFSNNLPATETSVPTVLSTQISGENIRITATFGTPYVTAGMIKGLGNSTPANLIINNMPEPNGSSDQFYINGVIHKIDAVLIPF
jgi:uncharacterized surface protein with fasciclin (FAS1) repeats